MKKPTTNKANTNKAKKTLSQREKSILRKTVITFVLQRFATLRGAKITNDFLPKTEQMLYRSVFGMGRNDTDKVEELKSVLKQVCKSLQIPARKKPSVHSILTDLENWLFGKDYVQNMHSICSYAPDDEPWPADFWEKVMDKIRDTSDEQTCKILGKEYENIKWKPNREYYGWWSKTVEQYRVVIDKFMQVPAPASPPSAPASAAPEPEPVAEVMLFDTRNPERSETSTDLDLEMDFLYEQLPGCDMFVLD